MSDRTTTFSELVGSNLIEIGAGRPRTVNLNGHDLPILRVANVLDGRIESALQAHTSYPDVKGEGSKVSRPGDVVLTTKGTVGRVALMPPDGPAFAYSPQLCFFRPVANGPLRSRFLYYWFKSADFWIQANSLKGQTDMADFLSLGDIQRMRIGVPSLDRQDAVVGVLGALDDKISANESGIRTAHRLMRLHYRLAVARGSTTTTLDKIATVFDGPHATPEKTVAGPWFLSISSLQDGRLALADSAHVAEHDFARWTRRVTPTAGDVLFSYETRLGEAALMPDGVRACLGRRMALLRPRAGIGPRTLLQAYLSESFQETIKQRSVHGATVDRIPLTELPGWPIILPDDADRLEDLLGGLDDMAAQRDRENETLADLRDTFLPRLMSGEIRVRDAEKAIGEVL